MNDELLKIKKGIEKLNRTGPEMIFLFPGIGLSYLSRSEERRVGKECRL